MPRRGLIALVGALAFSLLLSPLLTRPAPLGIDDTWTVVDLWQ